MNRRNGFHQLFESIESGKEVEEVLNNTDIGKDILGIAGEGRKKNEVGHFEEELVGKKYEVLPDGDVIIYFPGVRPTPIREPDQGSSYKRGRVVDTKWPVQKYRITKEEDYWYCLKGKSVVYQETGLERIFLRLWKAKAKELLHLIGRSIDYRDPGPGKLLASEWVYSNRGAGMDPWQIYNTIKRSNIYRGYSPNRQEPMFDSQKYRVIFDLLGIDTQVSDYWNDPSRTITLYVKPWAGTIAPVWDSLMKSWRGEKFTDPVVEIHCDNGLSIYGKPMYRSGSNYMGPVIGWMESNEETKGDLEDAIWDYLKRLVNTKPILTEGKVSNNPFNQLLSAFLSGKGLDRAAAQIVEYEKSNVLEPTIYTKLKKIPLLWKEIIKISPHAGQMSQADEWGLFGDS
jgi:hypothetical protein